MEISAWSTIYLGSARPKPSYLKGTDICSCDHVAFDLGRGAPAGKVVECLSSVSDVCKSVDDVTPLCLLACLPQRMTGRRDAEMAK